MTKRIAIITLAIGALLGAGATAAQASAPQTFYRGSAPVTFYRG